MRVGYAAEDEAFRQGIRRWFEAEYPRFRAAWAERHGAAPDANDSAWRRAWEDHVCASGYAGLGWPAEQGGKAWPLMRQAIFHEEQARIGAPLGVNIIGHGILAPTLLHFASPAQQQRFLPRILSNRDIWCQGYSEPGAGSDLAALAARAERATDAEGEHYVLSGHKIWTSFAHIADWCFVLARTDPKAQRHQGISFLLVDMKSPGVRVQPIRQMTGEADFNEVFFERVRVPVAQRVGEENAGWRIAMAAASFERGTYFIPRQVRFAQELAALQRLAAQRGRAQEAGVRQRLAALALDSHVLQLKGWRALTQAARGDPPGPEGSATKLHWSEAHQRLAALALELLGEAALGGPQAPPHAGDAARQAAGWVREYLWTRAETLLAGTSEVQRNILAEQLLALPRG